MATFAPTSEGFSQAQKSAAKMDANIHKNPTHPRVLIPCLHLKMQAQSPHTHFEVWPFNAVFTTEVKQTTRRLGTALSFGLVFVDITNFRSQNQIKLDLGLCCSWLLDF